MDYPQSKHISPYKGNEKRNMYNSTTILDEIWSKQRPAHDRTGLGYKRIKKLRKVLSLQKNRV